jgi:hypothetical protein
MYLLDKANWYRFKNVSAWLLITIAGISALLAILFAYLESSSGKFTRQETQVATSLIGDMGYKMQLLNSELTNLKLTRDYWNDYKTNIAKALPSDTAQIRKDFISYLKYRFDKIDTSSFNIKPSQKDIEVISNTKIPLEDIDAFYNIDFPTSIREIQDFYNYLTGFARLERTSDLSDKAIDKEFEMLQISGEMFYYSLLEIVADMPESVIKDFYEKCSPFLTELPSVKMLTKDEAKSFSDKTYNKYQNLLNDFASITGSAEMNSLLFQMNIKKLSKNKSEK